MEIFSSVIAVITYTSGEDMNGERRPTSSIMVINTPSGERPEDSVSTSQHVWCPVFRLLILTKGPISPFCKNVSMFSFVNTIKVLLIACIFFLGLYAVMICFVLFSTCSMTSGKAKTLNETSRLNLYEQGSSMHTTVHWFSSVLRYLLLVLLAQSLICISELMHLRTNAPVPCGSQNKAPLVRLFYSFACRHGAFYESFEIRQKAGG